MEKMEKTKERKMERTKERKEVNVELLIVELIE